MFVFTCVLMIFTSAKMIEAIPCGFPGRPAFGRAVQVSDSYSEGQAVTYTCNSGYYMVGTVVRRCLPNGTWTGNIPVCDTTLSPVGYTSSSEPLALYPPEMAVDNNKKSCFYSNRRKPRWWRMDMGVVQTVLSVAITVPFASSEHHFTIYVIEVNDTLTKYHKCASFRGIFSSQAMILSCGNMKGIVGSVLHIEDDSPHLDHFGLCEVEVFVRKDFYECGRPETPTNGYLTDKPNHVVTYGCHIGYKLEGSGIRSCMRNGQWSGSQPICRQINCPKPAPIENASYRINSLNEDSPELGSRVIYSCKPGHTLSGYNDTQYCQENGTWTGVQPNCYPVDCGVPNDNSDYLGGRFQLLNRSTKFQSMAELICFNGKRLGLTIQCRDDGTWSGLESTCLYNKANFYTANISDVNDSKSNKINLTTILILVIVVVLFTLFVMLFLLFKKRVLQFKWATEPMAAPRRSSWALEALRSTNIQIRRPFKVQSKCQPVSVKPSSVASNPSNTSISSKLDNVYEEIANFSANPITDETEDKIRRAAIIAAELAVINEHKQSLQSISSNKLSVPQPSPISLYARVDLIQKHKDRLIREQQLNENGNRDETTENRVTVPEIDCQLRLHESLSTPELIRRFSSVEYESIGTPSPSPSRHQSHILKDNMIFVGHPGVGLTNCDNLSQVTQTGTDSDLKRVYSLNS